MTDICVRGNYRDISRFFQWLSIANTRFAEHVSYVLGEDTENTEVSEDKVKMKEFHRVFERVIENAGNGEGTGVPSRYPHIMRLYRLNAGIREAFVDRCMRYNISSELFL
jgi:hypothetical protein